MFRYTHLITIKMTQENDNAERLNETFHRAIEEEGLGDSKSRDVAFAVVYEGIPFKEAVGRVLRESR